MTTTVLEQDHPEIAEAKNLAKAYAKHGRIFVAVLDSEPGKPSRYTLNMAPSSHLEQPGFTLGFPIWGTDKDTVQKQINAYHALLGDTPPSATGWLLLNAIRLVADPGALLHDDLLTLASFCRGNDGRRLPSDLHWFIARCLKLAEWGDRVGLANLFNAIKSVPWDIPKNVTGLTGYEWIQKLRGEYGLD